MKEIERNADRKNWIAAAASLAMPGLGQIYNGEIVKGFCLFALYLVIPLIGLRLSVSMADGWLLFGIAVTAASTLALYVFSIVEAWKAAAGRGKGYFLKSYNRWYLYLVVWLSCSVLSLGVSSGYVKKNVVEMFKIVTPAMQPQVLTGDYVVVDKRAYEKVPPRVGDIVVHVYPDDRSKVLIRKIEGLPGDKVLLEDGRTLTVPHGSVYVLGENREASLDSRAFGLVPLKDVLGKARQVLFSRGEGGIRWGRIGSRINSSS
jgi:signal peptidase I